MRGIATAAAIPSLGVGVGLRVDQRAVAVKYGKVETRGGEQSRQMLHLRQLRAVLDAGHAALRDAGAGGEFALAQIG